MRQFKSRHSTRLPHMRLLIGAVAVLLLATGIWALKGPDNKTTNNPVGESSNGQDTNLNPTTESENKPTEATTPPASSGNKKTVYPVITSASRTEVYAYVSGVLEDGGTCTATATQGSQTKTASAAGFANVSYTSCKPIKISLPAGTWSVVVSYSSAGFEGKSSPFVVN